MLRYCLGDTKTHALILSQVTLDSIPQPEELPSKDRLLEVEDLEQYLSQLDPFMEFHGYEASTYSDWLQVCLCSVPFLKVSERISDIMRHFALQINAREVESQLLQSRLEYMNIVDSLRFEPEAAETMREWPKKMLEIMQADANTRRESKLRSMPSMRIHFSLYDCGLFEETMAVRVSQRWR